MNKIILSIQITSLIFLAFVTRVVYFNNQKIQSLESRLNEPQTISELAALPEGDIPAPENPDYLSLKEYLDSALATISASTPAPASTTATISSTPQTSFIAMGSSTTTTATDWVDVPGSEVYVDLAHDYSPDAYVTFSATLKVAHGNGQAFARLYDATNKIAVTGSEVTTINNVVYTQVASGSLALWSGNNLYKVQIKSLNSFEVTYSSGKIKITY